jgi:ATP-binding cassette subfamily B protein
VRDLRVRSHSGALSRFHLDALLGWTAIPRAWSRACDPPRARSLLGEWARSGFELQRTLALTEGVQLLSTLALIGLLLYRHLTGP